MMIPKKIIYKVKYGYRPSEYVLVDNLDMLCRVIYARAEKLPIAVGGKMIAGQEIKTIEPDIHSYTGWNRSYEATNDDDFRQIERDVPEVLYELLQGAYGRVERLVHASQEHRIGQESLSPEMLLIKSRDEQTRDTATNRGNLSRASGEGIPNHGGA